MDVIILNDLERTTIPKKTNEKTDDILVKLNNNIPS